jgi:hypothetical protein
MHDVSNKLGVGGVGGAPLFSGVSEIKQENGILNS